MIWHELGKTWVMIKNYFLIAWRSLSKNKVYSAINITGLAIGLSVFWLMSLYIIDELSYDQQSPNAGRVYRVVHSGEWAGGNFHLAVTPAPFAATLKKEYSGIEEAARISPEGGGTILYGDKKIKAEDIFFADNSLLTIFRYPFIVGNPNTALVSPNSIVLTETLARNIFGRPEDALNKSITFEHDASYQVTGVMADIPVNSHLTFSALRNMPPQPDDWMNSYLYTYVLLKKTTSASDLEARLPAFFDRWLKDPMGKGAHYKAELQPLTAIHLHSRLDYEISRNGDINYIWIFSIVALLILGIAVINYINLATARSSVRIKEIGIRRVVGSGRGQLILLFLAESVSYTFLAAAIALGLAGLLLPLFNILAGKTLSLWQFGMLPTLFLLVVFALLTGLTGGIYPALFLSRFQTIPALKGQQGDQHSTILFRKGLVTFQFIITVLLIAGSAILYGQLHFMQNKDMGFNKDQTLVFHIHDKKVRERIEDLRTRLLASTAIEAAASAGNPIGNNDIGTVSLNFEDKGALSRKPRIVQSFYVDADFLPTLQLKLAEGRNFSKTQPTDIHQSVLINETLVKELGWTDPIGKKVQTGTDSAGQPQLSTVIGVVNDFNIYSLQHKIEPLVLAMPPVAREQDNLYVRINPRRTAEALTHIAAVYHEFDPGAAFDYHFLDENFSQQYQSEKNQGQLLLAFTMLAILIACLGLFGLVTFSVGQRTKEIGIRKVLGASIASIVLLIGKDLARPILLAIAISIPIAWYTMDKWLQTFAYRMPLSIGLFIAAGAAAAGIAGATVGGKAWIAAKTNPSKSLKTE